LGYIIASLALFHCKTLHLGVLRDIEDDFANSASFHCLVRLPRRLEGEMGTCEMAELPPFQELGNLSHGGILGRFQHVIDQNKTDGDVASLELQRDGWLGRDARRV
jgi:hypothetical protein